MPQAEEILDAGKQIVDDFTRIIIRNMVEGVIAFIYATPLTMDDHDRISAALAAKVEAQPWPNSS